MKNGDFYHHHKNVEYFFDCIALPLDKRNTHKLELNGKARYHEDTHDLDLYYDRQTGVTFIESDVPHVIYQSEDNYNTDFVYAREVDDFFEYTEKNGTLIKRFTRK